MIVLGQWVSFGPFLILIMLQTKRIDVFCIRRNEKTIIMPANVFGKHQLRKRPFNSHFTRKSENIYTCCNSMAVVEGGCLKRRELKGSEEVWWAGPSWQQADGESLQGKKFLDKARPLKLSSHVVLKLEPAPRTVRLIPGWHRTHTLLLIPPQDRLDPTFLRSSELWREHCQQAPSTGQQLATTDKFSLK